MSIIKPELEVVDRTLDSIRYLEHGWPSNLCRWHSHEEFELHLIVALRGQAFIGNYIGEFTQGSLFLTGPYLPHNWITENSLPHQIPLRDMLIQFNIKSIQEMYKGFPEFLELRPTLEQAKNGIEFLDYPPTTARSYLESIRDQTGAERMITFLQFLLSIHRHPEKKILSLGNISFFENKPKQTEIAEIVNYIAKNYAEDTSLIKAADMAKMRVASFSRHFQKITGKKFVEFINSVRVANACTMLYVSNDPISDICFKVGFQNLANFNRQFLKIKRITPSRYRQIAREKLLNTHPLNESNDHAQIS